MCDSNTCTRSDYPPTRACMHGRDAAVAFSEAEHLLAALCAAVRPADPGGRAAPFPSRERGWAGAAPLAWSACAMASSCSAAPSAGGCSVDGTVCRPEGPASSAAGCAPLWPLRWRFAPAAPSAAGLRLFPDPRAMLRASCICKRVCLSATKANHSIAAQHGKGECECPQVPGWLLIASARHTASCNT